MPPLRPYAESLTFGNPSAVLTMTVLFACSAVATIGLGSIPRRIVAGSIVVLAGSAALISGSRAGWLALALTMVVIGGTARRRRRSTTPGAHAPRGAAARNPGPDRGRPWSAVGVVAGAFALGPAIIRRLTEGGEDLRINYLLAAQRMLAESPLVGTGPGTWVIQRIRYTYAPETNYYIPHAHNIYAQTASELGIIGLLAGLFLVISLVMLIRGGLADADATRRRWAWAAAVGITYFAAHQLLDFYANMPAALFAAALPVAWLDATARQPLAAFRWRLPDVLPAPATLAGVALVAAACVGLVASQIPAAHESNAVDLANTGQWPQADAEATTAITEDPAWSPYALTEGLTAANVGDHARAAAAFRRVATTDDLPEAWVDLAAEDAILGDACGGAGRARSGRSTWSPAIGDSDGHR